MATATISAPPTAKFENRGQYKEIFAGPRGYDKRLEEQGDGKASVSQPY